MRNESYRTQKKWIPAPRPRCKAHGRDATRADRGCEYLLSPSWIPIKERKINNPVWSKSRTSDENSSGATFIGTACFGEKWTGVTDALKIRTGEGMETILFFFLSVETIKEVFNQNEWKSFGWKKKKKNPCFNCSIDHRFRDRRISFDFDKIR